MRAARSAAPTLVVERRLLRDGCVRLAALDEVGRGAIAGPVSVGAVVVTADTGRAPSGLRDSKLLGARARHELVGPIHRWACEWAVGHADAAVVDADGIMSALRLAATRALSVLSAPVDVVLLDGNYDYLTRAAQPSLFDDPPLAAGRPDVEAPPVHVRVRADRDCAAVAAASVLAKTTRDALMVDYARLFPGYGWADNKGYATPDHLAAVAALGPTTMHRRSWHLPGQSPSMAETMVQ